MAQSGRAKYHSRTYPRATLLGRQAPRFSGATHRGPQVDQILADEQVTSTGSAGNVLWALSDNLGTVRDIADLSGSTTTVTNHRRFGASGNLVSESNSAVDLVFAFTGKVYDEITGLQNNLNRWYDSKLGQWVSEDPIGFKAGDANVRRYSGNGTLVNHDPLGLYVVQGKKEWPDIIKDGPSFGTPKEPIGDGLAISIFGQKDNPKYKDYSSDPKYDDYRYPTTGKIITRPNTSELKDQSVSDISIRSSPILPITWKEIVRITKPGGTVTIAGSPRIMEPFFEQLQEGEFIHDFEFKQIPIRFKAKATIPGGVTGEVEMVVIQIKILKNTTAE